jgi:queuosine biosynthesis protein QueC
MKALVLLSGGQDSTTCLYWAKKHFSEVFAIGFDYGQMHVKELEQAQKIALDAQINYKIFDIKGLLAKSSLTEKTDHNKKSHINKDLPASFTSGRNILFLSIAGSYASDMGINDIITGVCQTDYSGYPDCRRTSIDAMQNVLLSQEDQLCAILELAGEPFLSLPFETSAENMSIWLFTRITNETKLPIFRIELGETKSSTVIYEP